MYYKYRSLLQNIPVRHLINPMKMDDMARAKQLNMLTDIDLNNIFLLGSKDNIEKYLKTANELKMYGQKYSWFAVAKEGLADMRCMCEELNVITLTPASLSTDKVSSLRRNYGITMGSNADVAFYFDATIQALYGVRLDNNNHAFLNMKMIFCDH